MITLYFKTVKCMKNTTKFVLVVWETVFAIVCMCRAEDGSAGRETHMKSTFPSFPNINCRTDIPLQY